MAAHKPPRHPSSHLQPPMDSSSGRSDGGGGLLRFLGGPAAADGPLAQHRGPASLPTFLELVTQHWAHLGLPRRQLSGREFEALAARAGFADGLRFDQPPLQAAELRHFARWWAAQLRVIVAMGPAMYDCAQAQLVCGFDVGRWEAEAALRGRPPGTFCLRLGSVAGILVLSLVEPPGKRRRRPASSPAAAQQRAEATEPSAAAAAAEERQAAPACVSHYLLSVTRVRALGLARAVADVAGCVILLDTRTNMLHGARILARAVRPRS